MLRMTGTAAGILPESGRGRWLPSRRRSPWQRLSRAGDLVLEECWAGTAADAPAGRGTGQGLPPKRRATRVSATVGPGARGERRPVEAPAKAYRYRRAPGARRGHADRVRARKRDWLGSPTAAARMLDEAAQMTPWRTAHTTACTGVDTSMRSHSRLSLRRMVRSLSPIRRPITAGLRPSAVSASSLTSSHSRVTT